MELRHLRYFAAVAETCHFGKAAEQLVIAQPALSQSIRQLEAELDATLFNRTTRQVSLTPAGEYLLRQTRHILASVEDSVRGIRQIASGQDGLISLGLVGTAAFSHLPRIARTLKRELPSVALEIKADMLTPEQCEALRTGAIDLAVLRPPVVGAGIELRTLEAEPLVLAVPCDHVLAEAPTVTMADLRNEPLIRYAPRDSAVNQAVMRACRAAGFVPGCVHEAPGTAVLIALVAAGLGVSLVPASARALPLAGVVFRDVVDAGFVEIALGWCSGDVDPVVAAVVAVLTADEELSRLSSTFTTGAAR